MKIAYKAQFKKDVKKVRKQDIDKLKEVLRLLCSGEKLSEKHKDHKLVGKWDKHRECHIKPDLLLIYYINSSQDEIILERVGSHSDLFK